MAKPSFTVVQSHVLNVLTAKCLPTGGTIRMVENLVPQVIADFRGNGWEAPSAQLVTSAVVAILNAEPATFVAKRGKSGGIMHADYEGTFLSEDQKAVARLEGQVRRRSEKLAAAKHELQEAQARLNLPKVGGKKDTLAGTGIPMVAVLQAAEPPAGKYRAEARPSKLGKTRRA